MKLAIPKKFEQSCLKKRLVWLDNKWIWFVVTEDFSLAECNSCVVKNFISLDNHSLIKKVKNNHVELMIVHTISSTLCIVTINNSLFILKRFECHFELILKDNNVVECRLHGKMNNKELESENSTMLITYKNGDDKKISLSEFCVRETDAAKNKEIQRHLHIKRTHALTSIKKVQMERMSKYHKLLESKKFISKFARSNCDPEEIQPLCRFGSIFTRTCNEKLIIGIPVYNQAQG